MKGKYEPAGYRCSRFIDGKIRDCVLVTTGDFTGWFCYRHPDGQFVSLRQATQEERDEFGFTPEPNLKEQISQLTKERDKWKQVALDYDDEICDWKNASGLSGETVDLTHEMLASKLSQLTKRAEAAEANAAAIHQLAEDMFSDAMKYPQLRLTEMHLERVKWMIRKNHGATLLARLKSLEERNKVMSEALRHVLQASAQPEKYGRYLTQSDRDIINAALKVSMEGGAR